MLKYRLATEGDVDLFFLWINDEQARANSYNKESVDYDKHVQWFTKRIHSSNFTFLIFFSDLNPVGQVRFELMAPSEAVISVMVDKAHRGMGHASNMIALASDFFLQKNQGCKITAYTFKANQASFRSFQNAGYIFSEEKEIKNIPSCIFYKV